MIKSKGNDAIDFYSQGKPVQKIYSKGVLVWERGGEPPTEFHYTELYFKIQISNPFNEYGGCNDIWTSFRVQPNTKYNIDWGDGTIEVVSSGRHEYKAKGIYTIKITECRLTDCFTSIISVSDITGSEENCIIEILDGSHFGTDATMIDFAFGYDTNYSKFKIKTFPKDLFKYAINIIRLVNLCYHNDFFETIPQGIFDNMTKLEWGQHTFACCPNLKDVPSNLYPISAGMRGTFEGTPLKQIPSGIATYQDIPNNKYDTVWNEFSTETPNTTITDIPSDYFDRLANNPNILSLGMTFQNLKGVNKIPDNLLDGMIYVEYLVSTFANMGITSIPATLFNKLSNLVTLQSVFADNPNLTTIPQKLVDPVKNPNITSFSGCFSGCPNIISAVPPLWLLYPNADGSGCFSGCTKAANYAEIPANWK